MATPAPWWGLPWGAAGGAATANRGNKNEAALGGAVGALGGAAIGKSVGGSTGQLIGAGIGKAGGSAIGARTGMVTRAAAIAITMTGAITSTTRNTKAPQAQMA